MARASLGQMLRKFGESQENWRRKKDELKKLLKQHEEQHKSWTDALEIVTAELVHTCPGWKFKIEGPYGLFCNVYITASMGRYRRRVTVHPRNVASSEFALVRAEYDGSPARFPLNSIGAINGGNMTETGKIESVTDLLRMLGIDPQGNPVKQRKASTKSSK